MARPVFLLLFLLSCLKFSAQVPVWHKVIDQAGFNARTCELTREGDRYLVSTYAFSTEFDRLGGVTGAYYVENPLSKFRTGTLKKYGPFSGNPYFVQISRTGPALRNYTLSVYQPGKGITREITFLDSLTGNTQVRPVWLEVDDSTLFVFGFREYRKIRYTPEDGFAEIWANPWNTKTTAAISHQDAIVLCNEEGRIWAINEAGDQLWSSDHSFVCWTVKPDAGGFIACGYLSDETSVLLKLNAQGGALWRRELQARNLFDVTPTADGGYVAAGVSANARMLLLKTDKNGELLWSREYRSGTAARVLEAPEGGYVVLGISTGETHLLKTDTGGFVPMQSKAEGRFRSLKSEAVQADIYPGPVLFNDGVKASFFSLKDSAVSTVFSFSPWLGGLSDGATLHISASDFITNPPAADFRSGLAGAEGGDLSGVWAVSRSEIRQMREDFLSDLTLDQPVPNDILIWPARGNPYLRYNADFTPVKTDPALFPAPFVDVNQDGIYNIYDGDYPMIKGDKMAWLAVTDSTAHTRTKGKPLVVDLLISLYTYGCEQNEAVGGAVFADFEFINRSADTYTGTYMGFFADLDIGCNSDDYIGALPGADAVYAYNSDIFDGPCNANIPVFGADIPVQSVTFLNKSLSSAIYYTGGDALPAIDGVPYLLDLPSHFYNTLQGKWSAGGPVTKGGNGVNAGSADSLRHVFPGNPADPEGWTMCSAGLTPGDHYLIPSHGPFSFEPGDTFRIQTALTLHAGVPHPCPDIYGLVQPALTQLKNDHNSGALDLYPDLPPVLFLPSGQTIDLDATVAGAVYQWSTGEDTPVIQVGLPGSYTVTITGTTGCTREETVVVKMGAGLVAPGGSAPAYRVWPNPAKEVVNVSCTSCGEAISTRIYNAHGQQVRIAEGNTVSLAGLAPGIYWLSVSSGQSNLGGQRLLVQN